MTMLAHAPCQTPYNITQYWTDTHNGVDFSLHVGTPIYATHSGRIRVSEFQHTGYGEVMVVENIEIETTYAHLNERLFKVGDCVLAGDIIAFSGDTGQSTGPHLHFGLRIKPFSRNDGRNGYSNPLPALLQEQLNRTVSQEQRRQLCNAFNDNL